MGTPTDALVEHLRQDIYLLTKANIKVENIIGRRVHANIVDIDIKSIVISSIGIGDGGGHREQTPYETREIECRSYDKFMATAEDLADITTYSILSARRKCYEGVFFVSIIQTGGPNPLVEEDTEWPCYQTIFQVRIARDESRANMASNI